MHLKACFVIGGNDGRKQYQKACGQVIVCMESDVFPVIGAMPIDKVEPQHLVLALQ